MKFSERIQDCLDDICTSKTGYWDAFYIPGVGYVVRDGDNCNERCLNEADMREVHDLLGESGLRVYLKAAITVEV